MGTFTTKLSLGGKAFAVTGDGLDFWVRELTVGQLRVVQTAPQSRPQWDTDPCYQEQYMCDETGIGSGSIWQYGKNIFASEADAKNGVIAHQQKAYKARAIRDTHQAEQAERRRKEDLANLAFLKEKYETN